MRDMEYTIKAHPTMYAGVQFRSRLEARWAAFFDLLSWKWEYEPVDIQGWTPDFRVHQACLRSECGGGHEMLVEVKPYRIAADFKSHKMFGEWNVLFVGENPFVLSLNLLHGAGGGEEDDPVCLFQKNFASASREWIIKARWNAAGNTVQWKPSNSYTSATLSRLPKSAHQ